MTEHKDGLAALPGGHRGPDAEYYLLPQAESAVMALGHAMAYSAARDSGSVPAPLLALYEAGVVRDYAAWFAESGGVPVAVQRQRETDALRAAMPGLPQYAEDLGVRAYVRASIVDDATWKWTVKQLVAYRGTDAGERGEHILDRDLPAQNNANMVASLTAGSQDIRAKL